MIKIATKLKQVRLSKKISQSELSKRTNIAVRSIQNYEAGIREPKVKKAIELATALDTTVYEIF